MRLSRAPVCLCERKQSAELPRMPTIVATAWPALLCGTVCAGQASARPSDVAGQMALGRLHDLLVVLGR